MQKNAKILLQYRILSVIIENKNAALCAAAKKTETEGVEGVSCLKKAICGLLAVVAVLHTAVIPVSATEVSVQETSAYTEAAETAAPETEPAVIPETELDVIPEAEPQRTESPETEAVPQETTAEEPAAEEPAAEETVAEEAAERKTYDSVPLYFQTDYPDTMYGSGTIASSGCSITSLAMVATYLTGHEYLPDELADYFGGCAQNNMQRLEYASEAMQLPYERPANWHETLKALKEGKIAIALMNSKSIFTDSQHFIVLAGMTEDGRILVNDPYAPNYERWDLKNAFNVGFKEGDICCGFSGAWVYDKSAMPEEPFLYEEDELDRSNPRYPEIQLTDEEMELLARMVWVEAQGESAEGQQAVAEVVLNRMHADNFPQTLKGVIYAEGQFRSVPYLDEAEPMQAQYEAIERALYGPYVLPTDVVFFATYRTNENVWGQIGGHIFCYQW